MRFELEPYKAEGCHGAPTLWFMQASFPLLALPGTVDIRAGHSLWGPSWGSLAPPTPS